MGRKHCGKRRNCSLRAISPFPSVFKRPVSQGRQKVSLCGNRLIIYLQKFNPVFAKPHSSVSSVTDLRTGGGVAGSIPGLANILSENLIVIETGFIPLSLLSVVSTRVMLGKQPVAWKEYHADY